MPPNDYVYSILPLLTPAIVLAVVLIGAGIGRVEPRIGLSWDAAWIAGLGLLLALGPWGLLGLVPGACLFVLSALMVVRIREL